MSEPRKDFYEVCFDKAIQQIEYWEPFTASGLLRKIENDPEIQALHNDYVTLKFHNDHFADTSNRFLHYMTGNDFIIQSSGDNWRLSNAGKLVKRLGSVDKYMQFQIDALTEASNVSKATIASAEFAKKQTSINRWIMIATIAGAAAAIVAAAYYILEICKYFQT